MRSLYHETRKPQGGEKEWTGEHLTNLLVPTPSRGVNGGHRANGNAFLSALFQASVGTASRELEVRQLAAGSGRMERAKGKVMGGGRLSRCRS